jgi:hypothetical protein
MELTKKQIVIIVGVILIIFVIIKISEKKEHAGSLGNWQCINGIDSPVKRIDGDIACMSSDGVGCIWGSCTDPSKQISNPNFLKCGNMHKELYGITGYDTDHWCNFANNQIEASPTPAPTPETYLGDLQVVGKGNKATVGVDSSRILTDAEKQNFSSYVVNSVENVIRNLPEKYVARFTTINKNGFLHIISTTIDNKPASFFISFIITNNTIKFNILSLDKDVSIITDATSTRIQNNTDNNSIIEVTGDNLIELIDTTNNNNNDMSLKIYGNENLFQLEITQLFTILYENTGGLQSTSTNNNVGISSSEFYNYQQINIQDNQIKGTGTYRNIFKGLVNTMNTSISYIIRSYKENPVPPSPTSAPTSATQEWVKKGCFMDNRTGERVIPKYTDVNGNTTPWATYYGESEILSKCKNLATSRGHNLIGMQDNGACFTSDKSVNYNQYGPVKPGSGFTCGNNETGAAYTNVVYILEDPRNPSQIPTEISTPATNSAPSPAPNSASNVTGTLTGYMRGDVYGNLRGNNARLEVLNNKIVLFDNNNNTIWESTNLSDKSNGNLTGNLTGDVIGNLTGNVRGNVTGNLTGDVIGNAIGNVTGDVRGNVTGNLTGDVIGNNSTLKVLNNKLLLVDNTGNTIWESTSPAKTWQYIGCFGDNNTARAIPGGLRRVNKNNANTECRNIARSKNHDLYAIQYGGDACSTGPKTTQYYKYSTSGNCKNMSGGTLANDVFIYQ